jgi:hypothetical protein
VRIQRSLPIRIGIDVRMSLVRGRRLTGTTQLVLGGRFWLVGLVGAIAAVGRSGVEEVYGVPYLDVGCDVYFHVAGFTTSPH